MILASPGEIAFTVFNFPVRWYGIFIFLAIMSGILVVQCVAKHFFKEYSDDNLIDLSAVIIISGLIGARLYYVLLDYDYFSRYPNEIWAVWQGGLSIHGAIIGAIIGSFISIKKKELFFLRTADLFTFGLVTGQIIGRWGNYYNSEAFGLPCNLPWKLYIPPQSRPLGYLFHDYFHPTFLYEAFGSLLILIILLWILFRFNEIKSGTIFFLYLILYSCVRICVETFRIDSVLSFGNIHVAHIASIVLLVVGLIGLLFVYKK